MTYRENLKAFMKLIGPGGYFTSYPEQILRLKQEYPELFEDGVDQIE